MKVLVISLLLLVIVNLSTSQELVQNKPGRCDIFVRCSSVEEPVWTTTDNKSCKVYRNGCYLMTANCNRIGTNQPARDIGKEKCQKLCKSSCVNHNNVKPICGSYNDQKRNFRSQCEMDNLNCATGKTFSLFREGPCPL
ncbi:U-Kazal-Dg21.2-like isoform X2 [Eupeodes corollae]|uniref:U-Kazal-Dg21.2-like isoform X2 n=1 Tax=Eupeodes corollae TaxID=290404 RepID=UPI00249011B5|nr:U-Kazal-Dg21.2-like isoform X2 [Eupeodes corollae]